MSSIQPALSAKPSQLISLASAEAPGLTAQATLKATESGSLVRQASAPAPAALLPATDKVTSRFPVPWCASS